MSADNHLPALYELTAEYLAIQKKLLEDDLPPEVIADTLEGLAYPLEKKAIAVAHVIGNFEAACLAMIEAETRIAKRRNDMERKAEKLRDYLRVNMIHAGIHSIESPEMALKLKKKPPSVEIFNHDGIPAEFMRLPEAPDPVPDKKLIAETIKAGGEVQGAKLLTDEYRLEIK